jgi:hypothetical protein
VLACYSKFHPGVGACAKFFFGSGWFRQPIEKEMLVFVSVDQVSRYKKIKAHFCIGYSY